MIDKKGKGFELVNLFDGNLKLDVKLWLFGKDFKGRGRFLEFLMCLLFEFDMCGWLYVVNWICDFIFNDIIDFRVLFFSYLLFMFVKKIGSWVEYVENVVKIFLECIVGLR